MPASRKHCLVRYYGRTRRPACIRAREGGPRRNQTDQNRGVRQFEGHGSSGLYLADWHGPRLTGSPEFLDAANWAVKQLETTSSIIRIWRNGVNSDEPGAIEKYSVEMLEPRYSLLAASPLAWSRGTHGPVSGELVLIQVSKANFWNLKEYDADIDKFIQKNKGQLRGKIVLISKPIKDVLKPEENPQFKRLTDADLAKMAEAPQPSAKPVYDPKNLVVPEDPDDAREYLSHLPDPLFMKLYEQRLDLEAKLNAFLISEGVLAILRRRQPGA